jgi:hypothetical protein
MSDKKSKNLKDFLKEQYKNDGLKVELTSDAAIRYSYYNKMKIEGENILKILDALIILEQNKELLNRLSFSQDQKMLFRQSLWYAIVVTYSKFFTSKDKDESIVSRIQLQSKDCYKKASEELLKMHNYVIEMRNKLIAHGTKNVHEELYPVLYLEPLPATNEISCRLAINGIAPISVSISELQRVIQLVNTLLEYLNKKIDKISDIVYEEVKEKDIHYWWDLAHKEKMQ